MTLKNQEANNSSQISWVDRLFKMGNAFYSLFRDNLNRNAIATERLAIAVENQNLLMNRIVGALERMAPVSDPVPTPYNGSLEDLMNFDWSQLGCEVVGSDQYGATAVRWSGFIYKRRSPENKYEPAAFYSRCTGKDETTGKNIYQRLATFKSKQKLEVEPISRKAEAFIG